MEMNKRISQYLNEREAIDRVVALEGRYGELISVEHIGDDIWDIEEKDPVKGIRYITVNSKTQEGWYGMVINEK